MITTLWNELTTERLMLLAIAALLVAVLCEFIVKLARVLLNRETVDQDEQLSVLIDMSATRIHQAGKLLGRLDTLIEHGEQTAERATVVYGNIAEIARLLHDWRVAASPAASSVDLDEMLARRAERDAR